MFKIYRYILNKTITLIPKGSLILDVQVQKEKLRDFDTQTIDRLYLYALVNTLQTETEEIHTCITGDQIKFEPIYKGTFQVDELVFHVFARKYN